MDSEREVGANRQAGSHPSEDTGEPPVDLVALTSDLRSVVGIRSRTAFRDRSLPALDALLSPADRRDPDRRLVARQQWIDDAISAVADPTHRQAAAFLLASSDQRWRLLKQRGADAGALFNVSWEGFRKKRQRTNVSLLDETLESVAATVRHADLDPDLDAGKPPAGDPAAPQLQSPLPERTGVPPATTITAEIGRIEEPTGAAAFAPGAETHEPVTIDDPPRPAVALDAMVDAASTTEVVGDHDGLDDHRELDDHGELDDLVMATPSRVGQRRRWVLFSVAAVLVVAGIATAVAFMARDANEANISDPPADCGARTYPIGVGPAIGGRAPTADPAFVAAAEASQVELSCAGPLIHDRSFRYQEVSDGTTPYPWALVQTLDGTVILLDDAEYRSYQNPAMSTREPRRTLGQPVGRDDQGTRRVVRYEHGFTVRSNSNQPSIPVGAAFLEPWTEAGGFDGLGLPLSEADDLSGVGYTQDFEHGRLVRAFTVDAKIERVELPSARTKLPRTSALLETEIDHQAWYIDEAGVRHWVTEAAEYSCLQRALNLPEIRRVPAASLLSYPLGEVIDRC